MDNARFDLTAANATVVVVDIQERLVAAMPDAVRESVVARSELLVRGAAALEVPVLVTEQYPKGLGPTVAGLRAALPPTLSPLAKMEFDCAAAPGFLGLLEPARRQVVLCGMEAHICVLQTARGLLRAGHGVWIASDGVSSRRAEHRTEGLDLARELGAVVAPVEAILFWMLGKAVGPAFKTISALVR